MELGHLFGELLELWVLFSSNRPPAELGVELKCNTTTSGIKLSNRSRLGKLEPAAVVQWRIFIASVSIWYYYDATTTTTSTHLGLDFDNRRRLGSCGCGGWVYFVLRHRPCRLPGTMVVGVNGIGGTPVLRRSMNTNGAPVRNRNNNDWKDKRRKIE